MILPAHITALWERLCQQHRTVDLQFFSLWRGLGSGVVVVVGGALPDCHLPEQKAMWDPREKVGWAEGERWVDREKNHRKTKHNQIRQGQKPHVHQDAWCVWMGPSLEFSRPPECVSRLKTSCKPNVNGWKSESDVHVVTREAACEAISKAFGELLSCQSCVRAWLLRAPCCHCYIFVTWCQALIMSLLTAPSQGLEMSIIAQPKAAAEEIAFGSQISDKIQKTWRQHSRSSKGGSRHGSHNIPKWQRCFGDRETPQIICRHFFPLPLLLADIF